MKTYKTVKITFIDAGTKFSNYWLVESTVLQGVKQRFDREIDATEFADYYEKVALSEYA